MKVFKCKLQFSRTLHYHHLHNHPLQLGLVGLVIGLCLNDLWIRQRIEFDLAWVVACYVFSALFLFIAFFKNLHTYRGAANVSTSKIATAAQGFREFFCSVAQQSPVKTSPRHEIECAWYHYVIEQARYWGRGRPLTHVIHEDTSKAPILVTDPSNALMLVHPDFMIQDAVRSKATVTRWSRWRERHHTEFYLSRNDEFTLNGQFATFERVDQALAQHLIGPRGSMAERDDCLRATEALWGNLERPPERIHALGFCQDYDRGMIHLGHEKTFLFLQKLKFWGLSVLCLVNLLALSYCIHVRWGG